MEGLWDKYNRIKEVFYRDFVYDSSYTEQASCIPLWIPVFILMTLSLYLFDYMC